MTIEYVLLLIGTFAIAMKLFVSAPSKAFSESGPRLGARVERQLATGEGFSLSAGSPWVAGQ
jgi:hypothetical protein